MKCPFICAYRELQEAAAPEDVSHSTCYANELVNELINVLISKRSQSQPDRRCWAHELFVLMLESFSLVFSSVVPH